MAYFARRVREGGLAAAIGLALYAPAPASAQPVTGNPAAQRVSEAVAPSSYPVAVRRGTPAQRAAVAAWLYGLDLVSPDTREKIITAWVSVWMASGYATLDDIPGSPTRPPGSAPPPPPSAPDSLASSVSNYGLKRHVNDVTRVGVDLAHLTQREWGFKVDYDLLVPSLILHDVDKPLLYVRKGATVERSDLSHQLPHGVIGAMLLKDLGFDPRVIDAVATHAANAPFRSTNYEAWILHTSDWFASDYPPMAAGRSARYTRPKED